MIYYVYKVKQPQGELKMSKNERISQLRRKEAKYREIGEYSIADEIVKMIQKLTSEEGEK